ncbi:MAG: cupin domain-containing protein [Rhodocyclaceae bacterium]|nr:cupin domain-containing protein [Rhodocyclaceae bacterium]MBX3669197.1 cupin domain-containing protein [Rhodocyclaceae bacterium]
MQEQLLGGLQAAEFLDQYWQKKPLLVRQALPGFTGLLDRDAVLRLAQREDVESRLVAGAGTDWEMERGPLAKSLLRRARSTPWTVLVQGLNLILPQADALMRRFAFIPYARLDDVMVSYATPGGGVGPHFDSYDVFLIQGMGRRRWQISDDEDLTLIDGLPLRILSNFQPRQEWVLEPGDMLYLPPRYAHNGIAEGECMTYSIGFRAPSAQELGRAFLDYLHERLQIPGAYADPGLRQQDSPAEIADAMVDQVSGMVNAIRWQSADIEQFLGCYLTEPKPQVFFDPPRRPMSGPRFAAAARQGVQLDARSQLLWRAGRLYMNGESHFPAAGDIAWFIALADLRRSAGPPDSFSPAAQALLYEWYCAGYLHPETP